MHTMSLHGDLDKCLLAWWRFLPVLMELDQFQTAEIHILHIHHCFAYPFSCSQSHVAKYPVFERLSNDVSIQENQKKVASLLILIIKLIRSLMDTFNNAGLT